jgi:hypothetical protein
MFSLGRTVQFAAGAKATQRAMYITAPTYGFVGASVITDAATVAISGAPVAGTNATITNSYAFWVQAGAVRFGALGAGVVKASATGVLSSATVDAGDISANAVTLAKLAVGTAAGQQNFWDGSAWRLFGLLTGTNLTDANQTLAIAGGAQYILSAALGASRDKRLSITGVSAGLMLTIYSIATRAFTMVVKDDAAGTVLFTFPASATPIVATFRVNDAGTAWTLSGWAPMATVV